MTRTAVSSDQAPDALGVRRHLAFIDRKINFYEDTLDE